MWRTLFIVLLSGMFLSSCGLVKRDVVVDESGEAASADVLTYLKEVTDRPEKENADFTQSIISTYSEGMYPYVQMREYLPYLFQKVYSNDSLQEDILVAFLSQPESFDCDLEDILPDCSTTLSEDGRLKVVCIENIGDSMFVCNNYIQFKKDETSVSAKRLTPSISKKHRGKVQFFGSYDKVDKRGSKYVIHGTYAYASKDSLVQDTVKVDSNFFNNKRPLYWNFKMKGEE